MKRLLVISNSAWNDTNSEGNTLSNWFSDWVGWSVSCCYSRAEKPANKCCRNYYCVSVLDIIKHLLTPWKIGKSFDGHSVGSDKNKIENKTESRMVDAVRDNKIQLFYFLNELIFSSKIWFNRKLKNYLKDDIPDICFSFAIADPYRYAICKYLKKKSVPVVLYIADDVYNSYISKSNYISRRYKKRFEEMMRMADIVYGASVQMCEAYQQMFNVPVRVLYKGCQISYPKDKLNTPLRIVYAGNLLYGRADTLSKLAEAVHNINSQMGGVAQLEVYSSTSVSSETLNRLNIESSSRFMGARTYEDVIKIMHDADFVLHVESFLDKQKKIVRYSFSTKIMDCLQSGSVLMVIGPKGISSVEYPRGIPGVVVIDDVSRMEILLRQIFTDRNSLLKRSISINEYAIKHHSIDCVRSALLKDFEWILN